MATLLNKKFKAKKDTSFYKAIASKISGGFIYSATGEKISAGSEIIITNTSKMDDYSSPKNMIIGVTQNGKIVDMNDFEESKINTDTITNSFIKDDIIAFIWVVGLGAVIFFSLTSLKK